MEQNGKKDSFCHGITFKREIEVHSLWTVRFQVLQLWNDHFGPAIEIVTISSTSVTRIILRSFVFIAYPIRLLLT